MRRLRARRPLGLLLLVLGLAACGAELPRNLLLISLDTLRADRLGTYGHPRPTSPFLDALAEDGTLFENAVARRTCRRSPPSSLPKASQP